jgi:LPS-assembly protein
VQYTFQASNGVYARAVFGQSLHLAGENAFTVPGFDPASTLANPTQNFSPVSGLETNRSDYVAGLYLSPISSINVITQGRFDEKDLTLRRQDTLLRGSYGPISASVGHSYSLFDPLTGLLDKQQDVLGAVGLRLTDNWSIAGMMRFDIDDKQRIQDQIQLKYSDECFVLTASYTETFIENAALDLRPDRTLMLRFELKYLGQFSYKTDSLDHVFGDTNTAVPR